MKVIPNDATSAFNYISTLKILISGNQIDKYKASAYLMKIIPVTYLMKIIPVTYLMKIIPSTRCAR